MNTSDNTAILSVTLEWLAQATEEEFVTTLSGIFEHSSWVAKAVVGQRPFASVATLSEAMAAAMFEAPQAQQRALINAHPQLVAHARARRAMTTHSQQEQRSAGLDSCTGEEMAALETLNQRYTECFGLPFVIAVKGLSPAQIIDALRARLDNSAEEEFQTSLEQIAAIARLRLDALIIEDI